jgi:hypothetical protein
VGRRLPRRVTARRRRQSFARLEPIQFVSYILVGCHL